VPAGAHSFVTGLRTPGTTHFFCTGSLVDPQWVLTAAHCVDGGKLPSQVEAVVGDTTLLNNNDPAEVRSVDRIVVHQRWGSDAGDSHDVAMVHLTAPSTHQVIYFGVPRPLKDGMNRCNRLQFSGQPLLSMLPCPIGAGIALGWGRTSSSASTTSDNLVQVTAKLFDKAPKTFWRVKSGACPGDSGGPLLVRREDGVLLQIGVASYAQHGGGWFDWLVGDRCSSKGWDYYSNVGTGELLSWFERVMSPPPPPRPTTPTRPTCPNLTKPACQQL
jgi:secreted trypsin-like serine protease